MKKIFFAMFLFLLPAFGTACNTIHEPWTTSPDQLANERMRSAEARQELRHRFLYVQTDR